MGIAEPHPVFVQQRYEEMEDCLPPFCYFCAPAAFYWTGLLGLFLYFALKMKIRFMSLASGSSGNCYYIGTDGCGLLVDAGIGIRTIKKHLKACDIPLESIYGILVTHDHADHIKALGPLGEKCHIPVYATERMHEGINRSYCVTEKLYTCVHHLEKGTPFLLGDFRVTPFEVPHDGTDNVGYCIEAGGKTFSFLTDLGHITPVAAHYICASNYLVIEANYDEEMLRTGRYPLHLQERIAGSNGHLSNRQTAEFLAGHYNGKLKRVWLCHLSADNNRPDLAYKTVEQKLCERGIAVGRDVQVVPLERKQPSDLYELE